MSSRGAFRPRRPTLARRLLAWYAIAVVTLLAVLGIVINARTSDLVLQELTDHLIEEAQAVRFFLDRSDGLQDDVIDLGERIESRVTVIDAGGIVLADSAHDPSNMENHAGRPEVIAALAGDIGVDSRLSETVGISFRYVALPVQDGVVYRLSVPLTSVENSLSELRYGIVGSALVVVAMGVLIVGLVARRISRPLVEMTGAVASIAGGDLDARMPEPQLAESARLADAVDHMADELQQRIAESGEASALRDRVLSTLDDAVLLVERSGRVAYCNTSGRELFGDPPDINRLAPIAARTAIEEALAGADRRTVGFARGRPVAEYSMTVIPIESDDMVVAVARNVTEQRRIEAMRRDFVADASHELKTPVAAISAGAETIVRAVEDGDVEAVERFAGQLQRSAARLARLVNDLLDLSRLESEDPEVEVVRLDRLFSSELEAVRPDAEERAIVLTSDTVPVELHASARDLSLALRNLLSNAVHYTPAGGSVRVELRSEGGWAVVEVSDTGPGIPSRELPRIFERFYRVDVARSRATGGTGLGLAIVKHVVERHGGTVEVESELGRGSTFRLRLPLEVLST